MKVNYSNGHQAYSLPNSQAQKSQAAVGVGSLPPQPQNTSSPLGFTGQQGNVQLMQQLMLLFQLLTTLLTQLNTLGHQSAPPKQSFPITKPPVVSTPPKTPAGAVGPKPTQPSQPPPVISKPGQPLPSQQPGPGRPMWRADFEDGRKLGNGVDRTFYPDSLKVTTDPTGQRAGNVAEFRLKRSEIMAHPKKERHAEILQPHKQPTQLGHEYTFKYGFMLGPEHEEGKDEGLIIGQMWGGISIPPPVAIVVHDGEMFLDYKASPEAKIQLIPIGKVEKGKWYDLQWDIKPTPENDGYVRILVNGEEKASLKNVPTSYKARPYFKTGLYWYGATGAKTEQKQVFIDGVSLTERS